MSKIFLGVSILCVVSYVVGCAEKSVDYNTGGETGQNIETGSADAENDSR